MATLYETLGHGTWVAMRDAVGAPVSQAVRKAAPPADHPYDDCRHPYRCQQHRRQYRRLLEDRKREQHREDAAIAAYQKALANREAMALVAQSPKHQNAVVSVESL